MTTEDLVGRARAMLAANQYLTLATAAADGRPWASTVWYAAIDRSSPDRLVLDLVWLSWPQARHSRNIGDRPEVGISVFDSSQPAGTGDGLQLSALAEQVPAAELDAVVAVFSAASLAAGGNAWGRAQVEEPAVPRLYVARVDRAHLLGGGARADVPV